MEPILSSLQHSKDLIELAGVVFVMTLVAIGLLIYGQWQVYAHNRSFPNVDAYHK